MLRADRPDRATAVAGRGGRARLAADEPWAALTDPDLLREILRAELPGGRAVERCEIFQTAFRTSPADRRAGRPVVALECRLEPGAARAPRARSRPLLIEADAAGGEPSGRWW